MAEAQPRSLVFVAVPTPKGCQPQSLLSERELQLRKAPVYTKCRWCGSTGHLVSSLVRLLPSLASRGSSVHFEATIAPKGGMCVKLLDKRWHSCSCILCFTEYVHRVPRLANIAQCCYSSARWSSVAIFRASSAYVTAEMFSITFHRNRFTSFSIRQVWITSFQPRTWIRYLPSQAWCLRAVRDTGALSCWGYRTWKAVKTAMLIA